MTRDDSMKPFLQRTMLGADQVRQHDRTPKLQTRFHGLGMKLGSPASEPLTHLLQFGYQIGSSKTRVSEHSLSSRWLFWGGGVVKPLGGGVPGDGEH